MLGHLRERLHGDEPAHRYQLREKLLGIGDDFWIETADGERIFKVDGKVLRLRNTLHLKDSHGQVLCQIQARPVRLRKTMAIERDGQTIATVRKALVHVLHDRYAIDLVAGADLEAHGNIFDHEYKISQEGQPVAEVSKKWLRIRNMYSVDVEPGQDDALVLAIAVCLDQMSMR
ncbi:MAG TPA: LURP-one-related family protein [Chloroflexota bacterium]